MKEIHSAAAWLRHFRVNEYPSLLAIPGNNPFTFWRNRLLLFFFLAQNSENTCEFSESSLPKSEDKGVLTKVGNGKLQMLRLPHANESLGVQIFLYEVGLSI